MRMTEEPELAKDGGNYITIPDYPLPSGRLASGYDALAGRLLSGGPVWMVDGMSGTDWSALRQGLDAALAGRDVAFIDVSQARIPDQAVTALLAGSLDNGDPVFGKLYDGSLSDFFDPAALTHLRLEAGKLAEVAKEGRSLVICYGQGASLLDLGGCFAWIDLPKEIVLDAAASDKDVLLGTPSYPGMKSVYWVDWPVNERHKGSLLPRLDLYIDLGDPGNPVMLEGADLRASLSAMSRRPFRVKPVFYPGAWGGQWMKEQMRLDPTKPNYAWSYELITPENGIVFRDGDQRLEVPFEMLIWHETDNVQGPKVAEQFGTSFPIRFNYDDTMQGGNLSCQVHPQSEYAAREFGLSHTQHETYYVLKASEGGLCYLGLTEGIDPIAFRRAAEEARDNGIPFDTEDFVNAWPARMHDLFLIPAGTVHNSGANNVVLEISSTPYLYTFKIYDYLRRDLGGKLRPIHIERAFDNIDFTRRTRWVRRNLIQTARIVRAGDGWTEYLIGDHPLLFFTIHRIEFADTYDDDTGMSEAGARFHAINLVEGRTAIVEWEGGSHPLHFAETMVIPAATGPYRLRNVSEGICKIVKAFVK
jgi:mannose-6-phosphate isomerase class I